MKSPKKKQKPRYKIIKNGIMDYHVEQREFIFWFTERDYANKVKKFDSLDEAEKYVEKELTRERYPFIVKYIFDGE
jgi:hypothetical protein